MLFEIAPRRARRRWIQPLRLFIPLVVVAAFILGAVKGLPLVSGALRTARHVREMASREPAIIAAWQAEFGDPKALLRSFPKQSDSEEAIRLVECGKELEVELWNAYPYPKDRPWASREPFRSLAEYENNELQGSGSRIDLPPEKVRTFLQTHDDEIEEVIDLLSGSSPPRWEMDPSRGPEAPLPNLLAILHMNRILVAEALMRAHAADEVGADRAFRASWNLNDSLRDRPEVTAQLTAVSIARLHAGLARRLKLDPIEWRSRLGSHDYRSSMLKAMVAEVSGELDMLPKGDFAWERTSRADYLDLNRRFLVELRDSQISDESGDEIHREFLEIPEILSVGEIVGTMNLPNWKAAWHRVDRLIADTELTEKVLQAQEQRTKDGRWPKDIPGIQESRIANGQWIYSVGTPRRMSLTFSRELHWTNRRDVMLLGRYESD